MGSSKKKPGGSLAGKNRKSFGRRSCMEQDGVCSKNCGQASSRAPGDGHVHRVPLHAPFVNKDGEQGDREERRGLQRRHHRFLPAPDT